VPHVRFLETARGTRLMTSSWWGWARKINYTGDWMMGLAWCLLSGTGHLVPYFYALYFGILLVHRAARDDHACAAKYGKDWDEYKKAVPYRFIPKVY
jgi:protein-S-isoprenylcysteine O-methyltransferase Ste14